MVRRGWVVLVGLAAAAGLAGGCGGRQSVDQRSTIEEPPRASLADRKVPAGTVLLIELDRSLAVQEARVGDDFTGHIPDAIRSSSGRVLIPKGALVGGHVAAVSGAGPRAKLELAIDYIRFADVIQPLHARTVEEGRVVALGPPSRRFVGEIQRVAGREAKGRWGLARGTTIAVITSRPIRALATMFGSNYLGPGVY